MSGYLLAVKILLSTITVGFVLAFIDIMLGCPSNDKGKEWWEKVINCLLYGSLVGFIVIGVCFTWSRLK